MTKELEKVLRDLTEIGNDENLESNIELVFECLGCLSEVQSEIVCENRWWDDVETVVEFNGIFIKYPYAKSTGDSTPWELGWERPGLDDIGIVTPHETITVKYY